MPGRLTTLVVAYAVSFALSFIWPSLALPDSETQANSDSIAGQEDKGLILPMTQEIFTEYCKSSYHADPSLGAGIDRDREPVDAYSIRCINLDGKPEKIDDWGQLNKQVEDACNQHYHRLFPDEEGEERSYTYRIKTMNGTYDAWECASFASYAGVPNFEDWCQSTSRKFARNPEWKDEEYPAFRWVCSRNSVVERSGWAPISIDQVCQMQYGDAGEVLARMYNAYGEKAEDAWDCFYPA